jgi:hypothetical protein
MVLPATARFLNRDRRFRQELEHTTTSSWRNGDNDAPRRTIASGGDSVGHFSRVDAVERRHVLAEVSIYYDVRWVSEYLLGDFRFCSAVGYDDARQWYLMLCESCVIVYEAREGDIGRGENGR